MVDPEIRNILSISRPHSGSLCTVYLYSRLRPRISNFKMSIFNSIGYILISLTGDHDSLRSLDNNQPTECFMNFLVNK